MFKVYLFILPSDVSNDVITAVTDIWAVFVKKFVTMKMERLTSNVVLFLIVALAISQGSVATHLWCDVMFSYDFFSPDFVNK